MDFMELVKERYSVRKFKDQPVEQEKLDMILEAGRLAPTAVNYQPQRILVLNTKESLDKLQNCSPFRFNETLGLLVCYDKNISWKRKYDQKDSGEIDASIVCTHMMLEAANLSLGSTWVGHFNPTAVKENFSLPDNIIPVAILLMGYPAEDATPHTYHSQRLDVNETVFYNEFPFQS